MKRSAWVLCGVAALLVIAHLGLSEAFSAPKKADAKKADAKKAKKKPKKRPKVAPAPEIGEVSFEAMKRELDLNAAQEEKLQALWEDRAKALNEWDATPQGMKLAKVRDDLPLATGSERATLASQLRMLEAQRKQVAQRFDAKILALLSAEQRAKWLGYLLYTELCRRFQSKSVYLSAEQADKVRSMCNVAGKKLPAAPTAGAMARMRSLLAREIFNRVLDAKQKKSIVPDYKEKGAKKRAGGKKRNKRRKGKGKGKLGGAGGKLPPLPKATPKK